MIPLADMSPDQERLLALMSDLSEDYMCASWLIDLENILWADVCDIDNLPGGLWDERWYQNKKQYQDRIDEIGRQAAICGGWITWSSKHASEAFLDWEEWGKELPARYRRPVDSRSMLLEDLTRSQLVDLILSINLCPDHLEKKVRGGGTYAGCLHCECVQNSGCLSIIDCMIDEASGHGNSEKISLFDLDCDPEGVVERLRKFLEDNATDGPI